MRSPLHSNICVGYLDPLIAFQLPFLSRTFVVVCLMMMLDASPQVLYEKTVQVSRGSLGKHNFKQMRSRTYKSTMERDMTMRKFKGIDMLGVVNRLICNTLLGSATAKAANVLGYRYEESPSEMRLASNVPQKKQKSDRAYQDLMIWAIITGCVHADMV